MSTKLYFLVRTTNRNEIMKRSMNRLFYLGSSKSRPFFVSNFCWQNCQSDMEVTCLIRQKCHLFLSSLVTAVPSSCPSHPNFNLSSPRPKTIDKFLFSLNGNPTVTCRWEIFPRTGVVCRYKKNRYNTVYSS